MADVRATLRKAFAACASLHAGFAASTHSRAAYGCDFMLDEKLQPLLLEVTFAPAPLWSSESMPARVDGVADDIFRTLFFGETARVTRLSVLYSGFIVNRHTKLLRYQLLLA